MNIHLFLAILAVFMLIYSILGFYASRHVKNVTDYFLAGRKLGVFSVTFALLATQIGGGMLLGTAQNSYSIGLFGIMYNLGMVIGFLLLGTGIAGRLRSLNVSTTAELFETRYKSRTLKKCASLLSILTLCGILVAQIVGSKELLASIGMEYEAVFLLFWCLLIFHTMLGGLQAVIIADTYQVIFILSIFVAILWYCMSLETVSFFATFVQMQKTTFSDAHVPYARLMATLIMPALFSLIEQDLAQRFFASRTRAVATISALCAGILLILFSLVPIYLGMKARFLGLAIAADSSPLMPAINALTNDFVLILATCGVIAAISSTADSLLCAISSNVAQDFDISWIGVKSKLHQSKSITLTVGALALAASYIMPKNIIDLLVYSYALSVSCLFVPLIVAYYRTDVKKSAAYGAIIAGFSAFVGVYFWDTHLPKELVPLILSALGFVCGQFLFCTDRAVQ